MKLSIIVPVYNMAAEGKLEYCLDSLLKQTISDYEVIAINDASTDNSWEILQQYKQNYPQKMVIYSLKENLRQGGAKNKGLTLAKGDFIGFVDSDDWVSHDCFEKMIIRAEESGADVVACDFCYVYEHTMTPTERVACNLPEQVGELTREKKISLFLNPGALVTKIYRRCLFFDEPFSFPEHMFFEDNATGIELLRRAKHFEYIPEPMYFYYQHNTSTVHVITMERCEDRLEAMRIMHQYAKEKGYLNEYHDEIEYKFSNLFYQNTLFSYMQTAKRINYKFVYNMGKEMREYFPDFQQNPYYIKLIPHEEKKLMKLQQLCTLIFIIYYRALFFYRKIRKKLKKS